MRALFVIRHHNDFDSITPVIDGWAGLSPAHSGLVYFATPELDWRDDYRTAILKQNQRVQFFDFWQVAAKDKNGAMSRRWSATTFDDRIRRKLLLYLTELMVAPGFSRKIVRVLDWYHPDIIAFDWYDASRKRKAGLFGYGECMAWARLHRVPLVSLPHGLQLYAQNRVTSFKKTPYRAIFVESEQKKKQVHHPRSEVLVSGSPRFDPEWVRKLGVTLRNTRKSAPSDSKIRIVFFATKPKRFFILSELIAWLHHVALHPKVELTIQPHPRGQRNSIFFDLAKLRNVRIDSRSPASRLVAEADIVSTVVSSVVVEAAVCGKEILFPKFLTKTNTQFAETDACVQLSRLEDTHGAIDAYIAGRRVPRIHYERFLKRFVYGDGDSNTIARTCVHLQRLALCERSVQPIESSVIFLDREIRLAEQRQTA